MIIVAYPFKKYNYQVIIDGVPEAGFSEVSAADVTVEPIEYREGNSKVNTVGKLAGLAKYGNVTLKWGVSASMIFVQWITDAGLGDTQRKKVTIALMDDKNAEIIAQWELVNAWPTKYTAPDLKATDNEVAFESIELAHEGMIRTK